MRSIKRPSNFIKTERGQSMVEMALMMVVLLTIMSLVLDMGRAFFTYIAIQNAAGEGALYAAINPRCPDGNSSPAGYNCAAPNNVAYRAKYESPNGALIDPVEMTVKVIYADGTSEYSDANTVEGQPIKVQVSYNFRLLGPYSPVLPGGILTFTALGTQNILDLKKN